MSSISITIPGEPVAKGRARAFIRHGHIGHYTPEKTARYESLVKLAALQAMTGQAPIEGPVLLIIRAFMTIPVSWSKKKQLAASSGEVAHTKRPDLDNILKSIKDGLNQVVWKDDAQVIAVCASKSYGTPRVEVEINRLTTDTLTARGLQLYETDCCNQRPGSKNR